MNVIVRFLLVCNSVVFSLLAISVIFVCLPKNGERKNVEHDIPVGFEIFLLLIFQL